MERSAEFYRDMGDHDAMFRPEFVDLTLARLYEVIDVIDEHDAFAGRMGRTAPTEKDAESTLRSVEDIAQLVFVNHLEARDLR